MNRLAAMFGAGAFALMASAPAEAPTVPAPPAGWQRIFGDGFDTDSASFPTAGWGAYPSTYRDTSGRGRYGCDVSCSVSGGLLRLHLHGENVAAPVPTLPALTEARYTVRFRVEQATPLTYKIAWLLWPDAKQSGATAKDGELDFPETSSLPGAISAHTHWSNPSGNADQQSFNSAATTTEWHTATIERRLSSVRYLLDGVLLGESSGPRLPSVPMHWVLQSETRLEASSPPPASASADVVIDWVTVDVPDDGSAPRLPPGPPAPKPRAKFICVM